MPSEAQSVDQKMDDGRPGLGKIRARNSTGNPNCATTTVSATALYQVDQTTQNCSLNFLL